MERASAARSRPIVRASPEQTAILKALYLVVRSPTQEQLAALSEQTGLTIKWVSQWFARQRTKDRKNNPETSTRKGSTRLGATGRGSMDVMRSPEDILQVKLEDGDPIGALASSPGATSVSEYATTLSASSSSIVLDLTQPGPTIESSQNRRRTGPRNTSSSTTRSLRSRRKGPAIIESPRVKKELIELSLSAAADSPSQSDNQSAANMGAYPGGNHGQTQTAATSSGSRSTASASYLDILPMLGPPKRSPMATGVNHGGPTRRRSSVSGAKKSHNIYAPSHAEASPLGGDFHDTVTHDSPAQPRAPKNQRAAFYQQGPVLRTQFYNNGPSNYMSSPLDENAPSVAQSMACPAAVYDYFSVDPSSPLPSGSIAQMPQASLAPAFDWENHIPFQPVEQDTNYMQSNYYNAEPHPLDPLHAPVKYLTHILDEFRDEQGMYVVNEELKARLVGEDVVARDPFQAAMGLSFLSRIGVEW
uniref:Homeobox domain-containing protein n=1 Tax=Psilocybe cubensis TaxID=181762 RepID=A0A8H8CLB5_PSICU